MKKMICLVLTLSFGCSDGDEIFIDDVELIYSTSGISDKQKNCWIAYNESGLVFSNDFESDDVFRVFSTAGKEIYRGTRNQLSSSLLQPGMYLITNNKNSFKVIAH